MRKTLFSFVTIAFFCPLMLWGQHAAPLRVHAPLPSAWTTMHDTLKDARFSISEEDRGKGTILTDYREYISGPLTEEYLSKIGQAPKLADAYWIRAEYRFDIEIRFVEQKETLVTVNADVRGLRRDFLGHETWVPIPTNGSREEDLLTQFGKLLFGDQFALDGSKKGLWERDKMLVPPDVSGTIPKTTSPERP
ncbi:MAG: hypothetical protein P8020_07680 [Acidobacteriota bacterium]